MGAFLARRLAEAVGLDLTFVLSAGYLLFGLIGAAAVMLPAAHRLRGLPGFTTRLTIMALAFPVGLLGARIIPVLQAWPEYGLVPSLFLHGGLVFYGGLLVAFAVLHLASRARGLDPWPLCDAVALYAPLGHAFGRLGCFLAGCCFGRPTDGVLGLPWPAGTPAFLEQRVRGLIGPEASRSLPTHPVQLYEAAADLGLFLVLVLAAGRNWGKTPGRITALYFAGYAGLRLGLEFFRGDALRGQALGLSTSQWIALTVLAVLAVLAGWPLLKAREKRFRA